MLLIKSSFLFDIQNKKIAKMFRYSNIFFFFFVQLAVEAISVGIGNVFSIRVPLI